MPTPVHARVRIGGGLYADARWSIGLNFMTTGGSDPFANLTTDVQGALETWRDAIKGLNGGTCIPDPIRSVMGNAATMDMIRCARVGPDGRESAVALVDLGSPVKGLGQSIHPADVALAASLRTGRPGASYRGRVYLPALALQITDGRVGSSDTAAVAGSVATWLKQIGDAANGFGGQLVVHPFVVSTTKGLGTQIATVAVGNRLDSQRRRSDSQDEVYGVAAVPQ